MELGEIIGWIGNISLAICGIPQAIKSGHAKGIDPMDGVFLSQLYK